MYDKKSIQIENHKIVYDAYGDSSNPPIILLHGWLSYRGIWQQTAEALKARHYCIAVDLLGFGESEKPDAADYSIEAQGRRIQQLADALDFEYFSVIGHSMGGQIALCLAGLILPDRVEKLVNIGGVASGQLSRYIQNITIRFTALARYFPKLYSIWHSLFRYDNFINEIFKSWFFDIDAVPKETWKVDRDMAFQPAAYIAAYEAGQAIQAMDTTPYLPAIRAAIFTIFGAQDAVVPVTEGYLVQENIPQSKLSILENCGHFPMYEKPEQYLALVKDFFSA